MRISTTLPLLLLSVGTLAQTTLTGQVQKGQGSDEERRRVN